jgi:hypothetical protein
MSQTLTIRGLCPQTSGVKSEKLEEELFPLIKDQSVPSSWYFPLLRDKKASAGLNRHATPSLTRREIHTLRMRTRSVLRLSFQLLIASHVFFAVCKAVRLPRVERFCPQKNIDAIQTQTEGRLDFVV